MVFLHTNKAPPPPISTSLELGEALGARSLRDDRNDVETDGLRERPEQKNANQ